MIRTKTLTVIELAVSALVLALGLICYFAVRSSAKHHGATKKTKRRSVLALALCVIAGWFLIGTVITALSGAYGGMEVEFDLFSDRVTLFGVSFAKTSVIMWGITGIVLVLCLIFRFFVFPKFDPDHPKGFQNIMELGVEAMDHFACDVVGSYGEGLAPYLFSLGVFMVLSAFSELFGLRAPTSDLTVTLAMGLITFVLINYYGIKKKGIGGRIKSLSNPTPIILPMKIISDIAVPVSLACRLFGNMLGGMIVMDLLKSALGGYSAGIPAVAGLYFNLFHPIIQAYIFIILTLTFINEAIE